MSPNSASSVEVMFRKSPAVLLSCILLAFQSSSAEGQAVSGELYSSLIHMNDLFVFDRKVGELLPFLPTYLPEVTSYKESYSHLIHDMMTLVKGKTLEEGDSMDVAITGNPLHLYAVIKRLVLYWPPIRLSLAVITSPEYNCTDKNKHCEFWAKWSECLKNPTFMMINCQQSCGLCGKSELQEKMTSVRDLESRIVLPSANDLRGASLALARLQRIYRIAIPDLATGTIANVTTSIVLSVYDCIRIANESYYEDQYANAWQWYNYAGAIAGSPEMKALIHGFKASVANEHDENFSEDDKFFPNLISKLDIQRPRDNTYNYLCRGNSLLSNRTEAKLKCYLSSRGSPYLILRPIKVEHMQVDPEMYVFYDVVSDKEIQVIKDKARTQLQRSMVLSHSSAVEIRVSKTAWVYNNSHPYLPNIAKRISAITGLHVFEDNGGLYAGEPLQVLSYGIGGHYSYHVDPLWKYDSPENWGNHEEKHNHYVSGDRLATWMFYLSDVEAGGRTAFPRAGVSVKPEKGSAVFWYNLLRNGRLNRKSQHGGCPVLLGHKWVANKWIRENYNFMRRPCTLDEGQ